MFFLLFLHNHTQKCLVNGSLSECCILMCGIPQDNIRASTVFAIHHWFAQLSVSFWTKNICWWYPSDLNGNIHSIQTFLNEDLLNIKRSVAYRKQINVIYMTKTEFKLNGSRPKLNNLPSLPSLNINNVSIKHSHSSKSLSMLIDENLTCENHVDTVIRYIYKENSIW